jgi:hypothetical protein
MKKSLFLAVLLLISCLSGHAQTTKTVGAGANYSTLKLAFDAINSGTITGSITLQIVSTITDNNTATLNASGSQNCNYSSVLIYPTGSGYTLSSNIAGATIYLNGADNVTIDGRVNASGATKDLVITNTNTGTSAITINLKNSAINNIVKYCTLKGSTTNSSFGIVTFGTSSNGNGNDNNLIDNNNITNNGGARVTNAVISLGSSGKENSTNTISNNIIYDFMSASISSNGVYISQNSTNFIISGNSFYETTTLVPTVANTYYVIATNTSTNHLISGNYIGGSAPLCSGSPMTINSSMAHSFAGIYTNGGSSTPVIIQNNIIQNINYTSTNANPWDGIYLASSSNKVTVSGNTIGASTGNDSIVVNTPNAAATATITGGVVTAINLVGGGSGFTTAPLVTFSSSPAPTTVATATAIISGGIVTGFTITNVGSGYTTAPIVMFNASSYSTTHGIRHLNRGVTIISNNIIGAITALGTSTYSNCLEAIVISGVAPSIEITNNLIGSLSTANSIQATSEAASSLYKQDVRGIYLNATITLATITGNTISNLFDAYTGIYTSKLDGISTSGGTNIIQNNIISNLSTPSASIIVKGIQQAVSTSGTNQTVNGNTIYNLSNTNVSANVKITGIDFLSPTSGTNSVSGNFVHSLTIASTDINSEIDGIALSNGRTTCANNIINVGIGNVIGYKIYGIYDNSSANNSNTNNVYFNSVYVGGTVASGVTNPTGALWNSNNTAIRNYRNNILMNARSGGSTGKHYAVRIAGTSGLTINYNDYYTSGTGGMLGYLGGAGDKTTLALWKTTTSQDVNSLNVNPSFYNPLEDAYVSNHYISSILNGVTIAGTTTDYSGITRGATPKMGALESAENSWKGTTSTDFGTASNWSAGEVPLTGANISFDPSPIRDCFLDASRTVGNITNTQSTYKLVTNGQQLTINGNLIFSNGAQINATSSNSIIKMNGTLAQTIPNGAFVSNTIDALDISNSTEVSLGGDLTIETSIALNAGNFAIGTNTLTFNGDVIAMTGTVTGGSATNMIIGGTGSSINMPSLTLNNLTINRASGVNLYGNLNLVGDLTLTAGTLNLGASSLIINGSSISRTTGTIDASDASSTLVFNNSSAISLPASLFTSNINNMTISGTGGVTANSNITINGILNLSASNPSTTLVALSMGSNVLTMGAAATTIGIGDVTGNVTRTDVIAGTEYSFGNPHTTVTLTGSGTLPSSISLTISIGSLPAGNALAVKRYYEIGMIGGSGFYTDIKEHYLDGELNGLDETKLITSDYDINLAGDAILTIPDEHGRAIYDITTPNNKYIGMANIPISYFIYVYPNHAWRTIFSLSEHANTSYKTWKGTTNTVWGTGSNWFPSGAPDALSRVIIPDANTLTNLPVLPSGDFTLESISIGNGIPLTALGNITITASGVMGGGAWNDVAEGFNPNGYKVIFTGLGATLSGNTIFYDVEIGNGASITNAFGNKMKIGNTVTKTGTGTWYADQYDNTIEYNKAGNQTVIVTDGTTKYHNLILSGSGTKTVPALSLTNDFSTSGTITANVTGSQTVNGELLIGEGTAFIAGNYNHNLAGYFENNGTFTANSGTINLNGTFTQFIYGISSTVFNNLVLNNAAGANFYTDATINGTLTLTSGIADITFSYLTLGNAAVAGTLSTANMIVASDSGQLRRTFTANGSYTFPIGKNTNGAYYTPITVTASGSNYTNAAIGVQLSENKQADNASTTNYLNRYWTLTQTGITSCNIATVATYNNADIAGTESNISAARLVGTFNQSTNPWVKYSAIANNTLTTTSASLPSGEPFVVTGINGIAPSVSIIGGGIVSCLGENIPLDTTVEGEPSFSYSWSPATFLSDTTIANPVVTNPTATTSYTVTVKDGNGIATTSASATITMGNTTTWNGSTWDNGAPTDTSTAIIAGNYNLAANISACTLTVNSGIVTIPSGFTVTLNGALHVNSGSFTLSTNANLLQATDVANSGNIIVKRTTAMRRLDYTYWSSPVSNQNLQAFSPQTLANRFYTLDEVYNNFVWIDPATNNFTLAKGFLVRAPNTYGTNPETFTGTFTGVPNNGTQTINITYSGTNNGSNLIGNPYPSPIDADAFLKYPGNDGAIYFWTHFSLQAGSQTNYACHTLTGTSASSDGNKPNGTIQTGQGFILLRTAGGVATFTNAMRVSNTSGQFFRTNNGIEKNRIWLNLSSDTSAYNQMLIGYIDGATQGVDASYDGKLIEAGSSISSLIDNEKYVIQGRALPFVDADVVPLNFIAATVGSYTINIDHTDGLFSGDQNIYLKDKLLGITHDLKASAYTFNAEAGTFANRFEIVYTSSPLIVTNPTFDGNSVIVYKQNELLNINTGTVSMDKIKIFDMRGRLLFEKNGIHTTAIQLNELRAEHQVIIIQITADDNSVISKKAVF